MIKFSTDENLGRVVDNTKTKIWCFGIDPVTTKYDVAFAGGGNKFGFLCAYKFTSKNEQNEYKRFSIAFVVKAVSSHYRGGIHHGMKNALSKWFIFKNIDKSRIDVLDKKLCLINYGFDVDKFLDSDMFHVMLPKIKNAIENGLKQIPTLITTKNLMDRDRTLIEKYATAISDSIDLLTTKEVNDKYYQLTNTLHQDRELDEKIEQELKRSGIYVALA